MLGSDEVESSFIPDPDAEGSEGATIFNPR